MKNKEYKEATTHRLSQLTKYSANTVVVKNILVRNTCVIQMLLFDFGKVQEYQKSPFSRFIYILEGKAEVVINNNATFMSKGDSILISGTVNSSIEAKEPFKMICTTVKND